MNDWLDYKGSGSARAYSANGLMSDSNISHGLFGIQTKKDKEAAKAKQDEAEKRYNAAVMERFYQLNRTADQAKIHYENIVANYRNLTVDQQRASASMFKKKIEDYKKAWVKATNELDHYAESELDKARKHGYVNGKLMDEFIGAGWRETVRNAINSVK